MSKQHAPGFLAVVQAAKARVTECTIDDVRRRIQQHEAFELIDVREESEYAAGHLPGGRALGRGILERDIEKTVPDFATPIVLYCGGGYRSALAADSLQQMGYVNVQSMDGGFTAWRDAGHPITTE